MVRLMEEAECLHTELNLGHAAETALKAVVNK